MMQGSAPSAASAAWKAPMSMAGTVTAWVWLIPSSIAGTIIGGPGSHLVTDVRLGPRDSDVECSLYVWTCKKSGADRVRVWRGAYRRAATGACATAVAAHLQSGGRLRRSRRCRHGSPGPDRSRTEKGRLPGPGRREGAD